MSEIASQITSLTIVYSIVYSDADQRKYQSSASLAFVRGIQRGPVNSPHKWPVTRKMFPFDDIIMWLTDATEPFARPMLTLGSNGIQLNLLKFPRGKWVKVNLNMCCVFSVVVLIYWITWNGQLLKDSILSFSIVWYVFILESWKMIMKPVALMLNKCWCYIYSYIFGNSFVVWIQKNIDRHTKYTIVSWTNPKQWILVHTSDLMMIIRQSAHGSGHEGAAVLLPVDSKTR